MPGRVAGQQPEPRRESIGDVRDRIRGRVVGRERELTLVLAAVAAGRDILLEGPPGTSKTTLLKAITQEWSIPLVFVEGNADLTPAKLVGHHNPARVLREDYTAANFTDGHPYDNIGTTRLSTSVHDRFCRLAIGYQDATAERAIVALRAPLPGVAAAVCERLAADAVALTRATRAHPDIRQGSSVRGAINLTLIAGQLLNLDTERSRVSPGPEEDYQETVYDAMVVALSGRIFLDETAEATPEQVLREIWEEHYILGPSAAREPG